jgi:hypothetical protein
MVFDTFTPVLFAVGLFFSMLLFQEVGRRIGIRRRVKDEAGTGAGIGTMEGAVFALLGLLIAFTFSGASSRFDGRRQLVAQEANAIGTAYLRLDLLAPDARSALRRFSANILTPARRLPPGYGGRAADARGVVLQGATQATTACRAQGIHQLHVILPALNEMIDITTTGRSTDTPADDYLRCCRPISCSLVAGYSMAGSARRSWIHMIVFAAMTAVTVYVILDIEYPRLGLIRVDAADQVLVELRESMK